MARVTGADLARRLGLTNGRIVQLVTSGVLIQHPDKSFDLEESVERYQAFKAGSSVKKKSKAKSVASDDIYELTAKAKLKDVALGASIKELKLKQLQGELVPKADVIAEAERVADAFNAVLRSVAPRIAVMCEGRTAREIEVLIEDELAKAVEELRRVEI